MQNAPKQSFARRFEDYQPTKSTLAWACIATALATMIIGFSWGGWVTGGTSRSAMTAGDAAFDASEYLYTCLGSGGACPRPVAVVHPPA